MTKPPHKDETTKQDDLELDPETVEDLDPDASAADVVRGGMARRCTNLDSGCN